MLGSSAMLGGTGYRAAFLAQAALYATALAGTRKGVAARSRLASAAASFFLLNAAAFVAFWVWLFRREARCWSKVSYVNVRPALGYPDIR
jgi:type II secretory pathway component PulM